jgi:tripartite-type tricarboxylate transporter receptor subunit TctC
MACKAISLVANMDAGGTTDLMARRLSEQLQQDEAQPAKVAVSNISTASGHVAATQVSMASDCTFLVASSSQSFLPTLRPETAASVYGKLEPVGMIAKTPMVLVVRKDGPKTLDELIALSKSKPGGLNYATGGTGSPSHLATKILLNHFDAPGTQIPYRGTAPAMQALFGAHKDIDFVMTNPTTAAPFGDDVRVLGVTRDAAVKLPGLGEVQPLAPGVKFNDAWFGVYAPPSASRTSVAQIQAGLQRMFNNKAFSAQFEGKFGMELGRDMSAERFAAFSAVEVSDAKAAWELPTKD